MAEVHEARAAVVAAHHLWWAARGGEQIGVDTGEADRGDVVVPERREKIDLDRPRERHLRDLELRVIGHPPSGNDRRFDAQPPPERGGLRPAAVHEDAPDAE